MRFAVIDGETVINVIEAEPGFSIEGMTLVASEIAGFGWSYDGSAFLPPLPPLDQRKADRAAAVNRKRDALLSGGYTHDFGPPGVHVLQTRDADDRINWLTSQAAYQAAVAAGRGSVEGAEFRTADNQRITVTFSEGLNVLLAMAAWGKAVFGRSWDLKDAITAAADGAALDAIDIEAGWPETPA